MGSILENYDVLSRVVLQALLNSVWPGLMLIMLAWMALRLSRRVSATTRHAIWVVCLVALAALPFLPAPKMNAKSSPSPIPLPMERLATLLYSPAVRLTPVIAPKSAKNERADVRNAGSVRAQDVSTASTRVETARPMLAEPEVAQPGVISRMLGDFLSGRGPAIIVAVWLIICGFLTARIAWSYVFLFKIRRRLGLVPPALRDHTRAMADTLGFTRRVRVFTSVLVGAPMTIGWLHPLIILPPDLLRTLSEAEFNSILAHEMAHIKRLDYLTNLLQRMAQAVFFFHPAVWVIGRQLSIERELACDDWAVKITGEPRRYARCLTRLVEARTGTRSFAAATGMIFGKHVISRRIEMILNRDRNATTSVSRAALYSAIGSAGLAVVLASMISPVIAIPLPTTRQQAKAESQRSQPARAAAVVASEITTPLAADPVEASVRVAQRTSPVAIAVDPEFAELPLAAADEPVFELLETIPATPVVAPAFLSPLARLASYQSAVSTPPYAYAVQQSPQPAQPPQPAPRGRTMTGVGQGVGIGDDRNAQPLIPEAELLALLTDVVKRDTDPNVRNEALRGIYRFRSDAGVNALLSLYDSVADVKTKGEILSYLMRSEGDNSRAIAKLLQVAKSEKDETLRTRAFSQLAKVKGDEGANHLISIYDTLQDSKEKQTLIRYLGYNKSRKAADKLMHIAKNDADPAVRQSAIRSLYSIDNRLYLDLREKMAQPPNKVSRLFELRDFPNFDFKFDDNAFEFHLNESFQHQMEDAKRHMEESKRHLEQLKLDHDWRLLPEVKVVPPRIK